MYTLSMKCTAVVLVAVLLNLICPSSAFATSKAENEARFAQKVKGQIAKLGTGPAARVDLKLRDNTKVKGYISEVGNESFVVVDDKSGSSTTVAYPQVKQAKGNNLSTGLKITIGVLILLAVSVLLAPLVAQ